MILSDTTMMGRSDLIEGGNPLIGPASIDLTLSPEFLVLDDVRNVKTAVGPNKQIINVSVIELGKKIIYQKLEKSEIMIPPSHFVLASTAETVNIPDDMCAFVVGRSSVARCGLQIECAGFIDPGFKGQITLELHNQNPQHGVIVKAGLRLCQIIFMSLDRKCVSPYKGKYQNQEGVTESRMEKDEDSSRKTD